MTLTQPQQRKVEQNLGLVGKVIKDKVHNPGQNSMLLALPADAALCQHVVIAADAKSNAAVFVVREPGVFQWVEVQVDDVVPVSYTHLHGSESRLRVFPNRVPSPSP